MSLSLGGDTSSDNGDSSPPATSLAISPPAIVHTQAQVSRTGESQSDPVLNFVGDMMNLMSNFAASYQMRFDQSQSSHKAHEQPILPSPSSHYETLHLSASQQEAPLQSAPVLFSSQREAPSLPSSQQGFPVQTASQQGAPMSPSQQAIHREAPPEPDQQGQSKKPRLFSPEINPTTSANGNSPNQPLGTSLNSIKPTAEWLGDTQEDLANQLNQLDQHSYEDMDDNDGDDGRISPFPSSNMSDRIEPLFTAPRRAWISAQISSSINDLSDDLFDRVRNVETKLKDAMKLINTQENKITQHEIRISDLLTSKENLKVEVSKLRQEIKDIKTSSKHTASGTEHVSLPAQPSQSCQRAENDPATSSQGATVPTAQPARISNDDSPLLPAPAMPKAWATKWDNTTAKKIISQPPNGKNRLNPVAAKQARIEAIVAKGNRTVGFKPISRRRIQQFIAHPEIQALPEKEREEAAKKMAVHDFLREEMLFDQDTIDNLQIEKIFSPRYGDSKVLYCQFSSPQARATITNKANILQPNDESPQLTPQIVKYIPTEMYNRYKALSSYAYQLRNNMNNPMATNIRFSHDDFELRIRPSKDNPKYDPDFRPDPWQYIAPSPLPDLPAINLDRERIPRVKPPGRMLVPSPLPVPQDILDISMEAREEPSNKGRNPAVREEPSNLQLRPLPTKHTRFPIALDQERQLQRMSSSQTVFVPTSSQTEQSSEQPISQNQPTSKRPSSCQ